MHILKFTKAFSNRFNVLTTLEDEDPIQLGNALTYIALKATELRVHRVAFKIKEW